MVTFEAGKETPKVVGSGASGFNACKAALNEDVISHGVIKVLGVDNRGNVIAGMLWPWCFTKVFINEFFPPRFVLHNFRDPFFL